MYRQIIMCACTFLQDPHYYGQEGVGTVFTDKAVQWFETAELFTETSFYNFCLPITPQWSDWMKTRLILFQFHIIIVLLLYTFRLSFFDSWFLFHCSTCTHTWRLYGSLACLMDTSCSQTSFWRYPCQREVMFSSALQVQGNCLQNVPIGLSSSIQKMVAVSNIVIPSWLSSLRYNYPSYVEQCW